MVRPPPGSSAAVLPVDDEPEDGAVEVEVAVDVEAVEVGGGELDGASGVDPADLVVAELLGRDLVDEPGPAPPPGWVPQPTASRLSEAVNAIATGSIERPDRPIGGVGRRGWRFTEPHFFVFDSPAAIGVAGCLRHANGSRQEPRTPSPGVQDL